MSKGLRLRPPCFSATGHCNGKSTGCHPDSDTQQLRGLNNLQLLQAQFKNQDINSIYLTSLCFIPVKCLESCLALNKHSSCMHYPHPGLHQVRYVQELPPTSSEGNVKLYLKACSAYDSHESTPTINFSPIKRSDSLPCDDSNQLNCLNL